jgi:peroxiredoxin
MKSLFILLLLVVCNSSFAQSAQEAVKNRIVSLLGTECIIKDETGKNLTLDEAADQMLQLSFSGKRTRFKPIHVVNGVRKEVILTAMEKPLSNTENIDFSNKKLLFRDSLGKSISVDVFKKTLEENPSLLATAYNAQNGFISEYQIKPSPQPMRLNLNNPSDKTTINKLLSENDVLKVESKMPDFEVTDIQGRKWKMKDLQDKIVIFNFWFVECAPCIQEMPSLNKLVEEYKNNSNVVFLSFSNSDKEKIKKLLKSKDFHYNHVSQEQTKAFLEQWKIQIYPTNVIVNKGKIVFYKSGGIKSEKEDIMFTLLNDEIKKYI